MLTLDDDQKGAILDALVAAVMADGKTDPAELAKFEGEVIKIPWGKDEKSVIAMIRGSHTRVSALTDQKSVLEFIGQVAGKLPSVNTREKVFATMATIMYHDRVMNELEKNVLGAFAIAFGLTHERMADIAAEVKAN
jgi:uncharacterized tellurite resistance protein B-like protein